MIDSGPLVAFLDEADRNHGACVELLTKYPGPRLVPALCITEVTYLTAARVGTTPEIRFIEALAAGDLLVEPVRTPDLLRIAELVSKYRDLRLGTVDASIVAAAERLDVTTIATLDHRHFGVVRPAHVEAFELVPAA